MVSPLSIYLHVPFCSVKCSYCAFNVYVHLEHLIEPFVDALVKEIETTGKTNPGMPVHTIYFGGGTPTLLTPAQFEHILAALHSNFNVLSDAEISTEANPDDLTDLSTVRQLRSIGIGRLSIGVQSAVQDELEMFGRLHDADTVVTAVGNARAAGFDDINLDLIYGNPKQTMAMWAYSLEQALALEPDHFSLYALGLEPKTAMEYWVRNNKLPQPDDDLTADMYDHATERLRAAGFDQYEISNWARPNRESQHNIQYWRNLPYLGLGPGAHGYAGGVRYVVMRSPHRYIERMANDASEQRPFPLTPAVDEYTDVSREDEISETIMMGMRLLHEGIALAAFEQRFGEDLMQMRGETIRQYAEQGYLNVTEERVRFTDKGRLVSNRILRDLI